MRRIGPAAAAALMAVAPVAARPQVTEVPAFRLPPSDQLSPQARVVLGRMAQATAPAAIAGDLPKQRAFYLKWNDDRLAEMRRHFRTVERRETLNGIGVDVVDPAGGIAPRNAARVLINVHGGAFQWGAGSGALVEAIPIAATMRVRVVTVDYRLAPEHRYPAASEDVAAVYRTLLRRYPASNIGIYGCSAGGIITAQAVAWVAKQRLPRPGAIGTFCGTGAPFSGDGPVLAAAFAGRPAPPPASVVSNPYMAGTTVQDARAYPMLAPATIAAVPPTLLLAGSRDYAASALTLAQRRLSAAGVPNELQLYDGLPHAFFMWPDMPESMEAYATIARFFDRHLGRRKP